MPVIFEEVVGSVVPVTETAPPPSEASPRPPRPDPRGVRDELRRAARRQARLRAD